PLWLRRRAHSPACPICAQSVHSTRSPKLKLRHYQHQAPLRSALTLGSEYGFALGGGRMASLFAQGLIGEGGDNAVRGGLRVYFGQHDKSLLDRNRQDDPDDWDDFELNVAAGQILAAVYLGQYAYGTTPPGTTTPGTTTPGPTTTGGTSTCTLGPPVCPL